MRIHCKAQRQFTAHICQVIFAWQERAKTSFLTAISYFISCHIISRHELWIHIALRTTPAAAQLCGSIWYNLLMRFKKKMLFWWRPLRLPKLAALRWKCFRRINTLRRNSGTKNRWSTFLVMYYLQGYILVLAKKKYFSMCGFSPIRLVGVDVFQTDGRTRRS
jgi:hypothetical protein